MNVTKKRAMMIGIFILAAALISFYFDNEIVNAVSQSRNSILNEFFFGITFVSSEIIVFFFLTSLFLWSERKRKWIFPLWVSLGLSTLASFALKIIVQRQRPFQAGIVSTFQILEKASMSLWNFSFPSFQAMLAFCAIPILSKEFPKLKKAWIIFAFFVAFSRVYFGLHFMSDVIAGGIIGYLIGMLVIMHEKKINFWRK